MRASGPSTANYLLSGRGRGVSTPPTLLFYPTEIHVVWSRLLNAVTGYGVGALCWRVSQVRWGRERVVLGSAALTPLGRDGSEVLRHLLFRPG